jgi:hypothetical protein
MLMLLACSSNAANTATQPDTEGDGGVLPDAGTIAEDSGSVVGPDGGRITTGYPVARGCDAVPGATGKSFYVDPVNGSSMGDGSAAKPWRTLAEVVSSSKIETKEYVKPYTAAGATRMKNQGAPVKPGDTLYLRTGNHGAVTLNGYVNDAFLLIKAEPGQTPRLERLNIVSSSRILVEGVTVTPAAPGGNLVMLEDQNVNGPVKNIVLARNNVHTTLDTSAYTAASWLGASSGIFSTGACTTIVGNIVRNVRFGITILGEDSVMDANVVDNYSGDGLRLNASRTTARHNVITNATLSEEAGDSNHDDGIQSFNLESGSFDDMTIDGNVILESTDATRKFPASTQGIGIFDGLYTRLNVINNVVSVTYYQGIGILGANDSLIAHNTVVGHPQSWVGIFDAKGGRKPTNSYVRNNIGFKVVGGSATDKNIEISNPAQHFVTFDYATKRYDFHLLPTSTAKKGGSATGGPAVDIEGKVRANPPSVGAYE